MNDEILDLFSKIIPLNLINNAKDNRKVVENEIRILIEKKKWPNIGWRENVISLFLGEISLMDSNNWKPLSGVGEREGRVICPLVASWHLGLSHGIGRSGDIAEVQPKAIGSSVLMKLTNALATDALQTIGLKSIESAIVVPMATGMSLMFCMLTLKQERAPQARYVIWSRCDQKSAIKAINSAGMELKVVSLLLDGKELTTNVGMFELLIDELGAENILCLLTTTSAFAPRSPDKIDEISVLAQRHNIPHIVNNAYGLQSTKCIHLIQQGMQVGRVDLIVQSTDKNFLVPVGGSIIASPSKSLLQKVAQMYPGRASSTAHVDFLATMLYLGWHGYKSLLQQRKDNFQYLLSSLTSLAQKFNQRIIYHKPNSISIGMSLDSLGGCQATMIGSMINKRNVSGVRVLAHGVDKVICGTTFKNFGSNYDAYPHEYMTAAAALGSSTQQIDFFINKVNQVLTQVYKQYSIIVHPLDSISADLKLNCTDLSQEKTTIKPDIAFTISHDKFENTSDKISHEFGANKSYQLATNSSDHLTSSSEIINLDKYLAQQYSNLDDHLS